MIFERARELLLAEGFDDVGGVDFYRVDFSAHADRFKQWLDRKFDADMSYLSRRAEERVDPHRYFPEGKSILCVSWFYPTLRTPSDHGPRQARYLEGPDYHERLKSKLRSVAKVLEQEFGVRALPVVDTSPVLERSWAALSGLGWIGKNTLLIHPKKGSFFFIGSLILDVELGQAPSPLPDLCGHCTRCLEGCPTRAFPEPRWLDANQCISYQTLEHRREIPNDLSGKMDRWIAGCDVCQEVCPFNQKAIKGGVVFRSGAHEWESGELSWTALLKESATEYRKRAKTSAIDRVKPWMMSRNLAVALRNAILEASPADRKTFFGSLRSTLETRESQELDKTAKSEWGTTLRIFKNFVDQS